MNTLLPYRIVHPDDRLVMIVGSYGSGKTEIAVNLALDLVRAGRPAQIADLDLVNPYFRCREARAIMEAHGIRVVAPLGSQEWADLPIVLPEIRGMLHPEPPTVTIFDVGGDDVGARSLATFRTALGDAEYELWQVVNAKRPFTDTVDGCIAMQRSIERSSRFAVTGLIVNTHLMDHTTLDVVLDGWRLARHLSRETRLPIRCVSVMAELSSAPELACIDAPFLPLVRRMLPPWLRRATLERTTPSTATDPNISATRPRPTGAPDQDQHGQHRD